MASIQPHSGGKYRVFWRDPDGRQHGRVFSSKREAERFRAEVAVRVSRGLPGLPARTDPLPAEEAVAAYLDFIATHRAPGSERTYESTLNQFVAWWSHSGSRTTQMTDLDLTTLEGWYAAMTRSGKVGQRTRVGYVRRVSKWWEWTARRNPSRCAPWVSPDLPRKVVAPKPVAPSWPEMDACVQAARDGAAHRRSTRDPGWVERIAMVLRFTGLRIEQASLLEWDDFDLDAGILHVRGETEKTKKERTVPISPHLIQFLAGLGRREGPLFHRAGVPEAKWINRCWRAAKVRPAIHGWHAFRRGFETGLLAGGVDLVRVRALVGHSSGVDDSYIDAAGLDLRAAVMKIPAVGASPAHAVSLDDYREAVP